MRKNVTLFCLLLVAVSSRTAIFAQDAPKPQESAKAPESPGRFFHLDFVVQELGADGKPVNSRSYASTVSTDRSDSNASIRTGSRVPVPTGTSTGSASYQYIDVGVNIDVRNAHEVNGKLAITLAADISSLAREPSPAGSTTPVIRNNRWQAPVLLPLNKATIVFTSDALDTKGSMQLVVTATPLQ